MTARVHFDAARFGDRTLEVAHSGRRAAAAAASSVAAKDSAGKAIAAKGSTVKEDDEAPRTTDRDDSESDFHSLLNKYRSSSSEEDDSDSSPDDSDDAPKKQDGSRVISVPLHGMQPLHEVLPLVAQNPFEKMNDAPASSEESSVYTADSPADASSEADSAPPVEERFLQSRFTALPAVEETDSAPASSSSTPMAFAAKLTPEQNNAEQNNENAQAARSTPAPPPAQPANPAPQKEAAASEAAGDNSDPAGAIEKVVKMDAPAPADPQVHGDGPVKLDAVPKKESAPNVSAAERMQPLIEAPAAPSGSGHDISVRLPDAAERAIDVRFVERGGEIHVSVRTGDLEAAQALRSGLNDFVGRMDHAGIRTEVWRPGADASSSQSDSQNQGSDPRDQRGSGRHSSGAQDREEQQRSNKPKWVEALENATSHAG